MVKIVTNFENGVQIEEAPNSLRTIAPYVDVSLYGLTASGVAFYEISFVRKMFGDIRSDEKSRPHLFMMYVKSQ